MKPRVLDTLDLTAPGVVMGRHAAWLPGIGVKVPFQHAGAITKYTHVQPGSSPEKTLPHEVAILDALAARDMAPPVGGFVYFKEIVSKYAGAWRCDPLGAYGYEMGDAVALPPGRFSIEEMRRLPIRGSDGAWNDILKPGNVVNGRLVDVRRTDWDMLQWGGALPVLPRYVEDLGLLEERARKECQFPKGERPEPYQDFWLGDRLVRGSRCVEARAAQVGFAPSSGESVLDIGCQSGGMLQYSWRRQGTSHGPHAGVDVDADYVACARALARAAGQNLCIRLLDVARAFDELVAWTRAFFGGPPDHLLLLSMEKHLGEPLLWRIVDTVCPRRTYIETNAMKPGVYRLRAEVERRGGGYVGDSTDRNVRRLYRIPA